MLLSIYGLDIRMICIISNLYRRPPCNIGTVVPILQMKKN